MMTINEVLKPTQEEEKEREQKIEQLLTTAEKYASEAERGMTLARGSDHQMIWDGEKAIYAAIKSLQEQNKAMLEMIKELYKRI